ncbi:hypothetical protein [Micromonospora maritima]|uniref:hypothetical protein n=1 Tax=Micromonospora maritima TaxID=986711 RepID=UPI0031E7B429
MDRSWLFADLAVPGTGCVDARAAELVGTVVTRLVTEVRAADPAVRWFFDRLDSPAPARLRLGLHARSAALDLARERLGPTARPAPPGYAVRDPARGGPLAHAGSELALTLLGGEPPWLAGLELPLAVTHLRHLCGLVPAGDRPAFLFLHWQDRSRPLTGAQRRDLAAQAQAGADKIVLAAADLPLAEEPVAAAWGRYLDRVDEVAAQDHPAAPRGFLIATHAQLTHCRWGIDPAVDALAALALRMAGPGVPAPAGRAG